MLDRRSQFHQVHLTSHVTIYNESYRQMIEQIGDTDPTTKHMLISIMAMEEEHADDMRDLLA